MNRPISGLTHALLAAGCVAASISSAIPEAQGARNASMAENRLILDKNNVFIFPQLAAEYANLVSFDYGRADGVGLGEDGRGSGLALVGDETKALGIAIAHGDVLVTPYTHFFPHDLGDYNLDNTNNFLDLPPGLNPLPAPADDALLTDAYTIGDLMGSLQVGDGLLGARVSVGHGAQIATDLESVESGNGQIFGAFSIGYSYFGDVQIDSNLSLHLGSGGVFAEEDIADAGYVMGGGSLRSYVPLDGDVELGVLAHLDRARTTLITYEYDEGNEQIDEQTGQLTTLSALAGAGPVYRIGETTVGLYGVLGVSRVTGDPDIDESDNTATFRTLTLPGVHLAADIEIVEWLYFRTGLQYRFFTSRTITEQLDEDGEPDDTRDIMRGGNMNWRAGIGVEVGNFTFDGTFEPHFLTNGPSFLGGALSEASDESAGMFTMVSVGYRF